MLLWGVFDLLLFAVSLLVCYVALTYLKVAVRGLAADLGGVLIIVKVGQVGKIKHVWENGYFRG
jgi:hypothetical protein